MAFTKNDRFGNKQIIVGMKDKKGTGYPIGFIESGNKLYKFSFCDANNNEKGIEKWCTFTECKKQNGNKNQSAKL